MKTNCKTTDAVIGLWPEVFEHYGLPPVTGKRHFKGKCPACQSKGSFRCDDKDGRGTWVCKCGAGDGWKLLAITQGKDFKTLAAEVDTIIGREYQPNTESQPVENGKKKQREAVSKKYSGLADLRGTTGEMYLRNRGINTLPSDAIRFCLEQPFNGRHYQSLFSLATDDKGALCYLHRTLLDGDKKANLGESAKRMLSLQEDSYLEHAGSVAIRMFPPASTLGIAEGIETALSCRQIYGCNVWAVLNTSLMKRFRAPMGVKHLIIFADTDLNGAGHAAAFECGHRNILSNNDVEKVSIRWPESGDFNDMLINGAQVFEWPLGRAA